MASLPSLPLIHLPPPQACLYALLAYNNCLGQAITAAEDALEDKQAQEAQHNQVGSCQPHRCYVSRDGGGIGTQRFGGMQQGSHPLHFGSG